MTRRLLIGLAIVAALLVSPVPLAAQGGDTEAELEQELAERYAPIVMVKAQDGPCDKNGEPFEPAPVEIVLDNPEVFLRQVGNDDPVAIRGPGASDIFGLQEGWYLEFPGDALDPQCIFETDYRRFSAELPSVVYAHVATEDGYPDMLGLQYWFFWYHNPSKNDHEGDWEFMQLLFDVGTVEEALQTEPIEVGLAQHIGGEKADWDGDEIEKEGRRLIVYPAKGSHASYFKQAVFLGRSDEFFGCDNTDEPSRRVEPEVVLLPDDVTDRDDPLAWLTFLGRWGQREQGFFNGPTGPKEKDRWDEPITWHEELRENSVVIPAGDRYDSIAATFCTTVEQGSLLLIRIIRSPIILVVVGLLAYLVILFARQTTWSPVTTQPLRARRRAGQILRSAFRLAAQRPVTLLGIGLIALPLSLATSLVQAIVQLIPLVGDLLSVAGGRSETGVALALLVGSVGNAVAYVAIAGAVAAVIDQPHPTRATVADAIAPLLSTLLRALAIVIGLLLTVVGIPWAIRQIVRYQLLPQVVVLEGLEGSAALRRCGEIVQGRWWWTAGVVAVLRYLITTAGLLFALIALIIFSGVPLWLFSLFSAMVAVLLLPIFAAVMAFVYGELVTSKSEAPPSPAPEPVDIAH